MESGTLTRQTECLGSESILLEDLVAGDLYTVRLYLNMGGKESDEIICIASQRTEPVITTTLMEVVSQTKNDTIIIGYTAESQTGVFSYYVFYINVGSNNVMKEKSSTDPTRTVTFPSLMAGTVYTVYAYTVSGTQQSDPINVSVTTLPNMPSVTVNPSESSCLVTIFRPTGGVDLYSISCSPNCASSSQTIAASDPTSQQVSLVGLSPNTLYTISVNAQKLSKSSSSNIVQFLTKQSAPGPLSNITLLFNSAVPTAATLYIAPPVVADRHGNITRYHITYSVSEQNVSGSWFQPVLDQNQVYYYNITVQPGWTYNFQVNAFTIDWGVTTNYSLAAPVGKPSIISASAPTASSISWSQAMVTFQNCFSANYGQIQYYSVIVIKGPSITNESFLASSDLLPSWQEQTASGEYVAINRCEGFFESRGADSNCWNSPTQQSGRRRRDSSSSSSSSVTIGGDSSCSEKSNGYCNGPLQPSTTYSLILRAYTSDDVFVDQAYPNVFTTTLPLPYIIGGVLGGFFGLIVVVLLIVLLVVLVRRGALCCGKDDEDMHRPIARVVGTSKKKKVPTATLR